MSRQLGKVKDPLVYRVAPDKKLENWKILQEGAKAPFAKGLSKGKALKMATRLAEKSAGPALVLVHKTRYIIERSLQFSQ
jgi:hypothetical protein